MTYNYQINFLDWFIIGLPISCMLLPISWFVLTYLCFPINKLKNLDSKVILVEQNKLGKLTIDEIMVCTVFFVTAALWISRKSSDF